MLNLSIWLYRIVGPSLVIAGLLGGCTSLATEGMEDSKGQRYGLDFRHPSDRWMVKQELALSGSVSKVPTEMTLFEEVSFGFIRQQAHRCPPFAMCIWNGAVFTYFEFISNGRTKHIEIPFVDGVPQLNRWTDLQGYLIGMSPVRSQASESPKTVLVTVARLCSDPWLDQRLALGMPVPGPEALMVGGHELPDPTLPPQCDVGP
ncbi:MAG: hypothetical protein AB8C46_16800 [Burkholderiaceae bacterium]